MPMSRCKDTRATVTTASRPVTIPVCLYVGRGDACLGKLSLIAERVRAEIMQTYIPKKSFQTPKRIGMCEYPERIAESLRRWLGDGCLISNV